MIRTVIYPAAGAAMAATPLPSQPPDKYADKLVKYLPAEVISFYVALYALAQGHLWAEWCVLVLGMIGTLGYLYVRADAAQPPRWYFYLLSIVAFLAWAIGTSPVGKDLFCLPEYAGKIMLPSAVFLVPLLDEVLTKWLQPRPMKLSSTIIAFVGLAGVLAGCASLDARYVGNPAPGQHVGGLPIVVERPRWLKATYKTVTYAQVTTKEKVTPDGKNTEQEVTVDRLAPVEEIAFDIVTAGELYALDLKRPAAGSADYEIDFAEGRYYPKLVKGKVEDKTIQEMRETIDKLLQQVPKALAGVPTASAAPEKEVTVIKLAESVKRIELYDIHNPAAGPVLTLKP